MPVPSDTSLFVADFSHLKSEQQADTIEGIFRTANADAVKTAITRAPTAIRKAAAEGSGGSFPDVPARDRKVLYLTAIIILAVLAAGALVGAGIALMNKAESAAFFTFAGLALGGITALFVPSPTQR